MISLLRVVRHGHLCPVEGVPSIVLGFLQQRSLIIFIFVNVVQHMLLLFGHKHSIILFKIFLFCSTFHSAFSLRFFLNLSTFFLKIVKTVDELLGEEPFVFLEPIFLAPKSCSFDILYFKLDVFAGNGGYVNVEIVPHNFIITVQTHSATFTL